MAEVKTYENVNREQTELSFGISKMEEIYQKHGGKADEPHRHSFYTILLVEKGKGEHRIDFNSYPIQGNEIFFIAPGQVHQLIEKEASKGYSIVFSVEFLLKNHIPTQFIDDLNLFRDFGDTPSLKIDRENLIQLKTFADEMYRLHKTNEALKYESIGSFLKLFLIKCNQWCELPDENLQNLESGRRILRKFKQLINDNYKEWHQSQEYADALHISADHLNRVVKSLSGKTSKEHIQSRITIAAKRLLFFTDLSTKEIAYELGFNEPGNFSAFFKKCTGQTPSKFKLQS